MKGCDLKILLVLSFAVAVIAETQPIYFGEKTDCVKSLPPGKTDELCIKCQPFLGCPSGSKWMIRSRRFAKAAGVDKGKCSRGFYMDGTGTCVRVSKIPIPSGGALDQLFKTTTTATTTTSTSMTQESVVNVVSSMPTTLTASKPSSTTIHNLTKIFDVLDNAQVIDNDTTIVIFLAFFLTPIVCILFYILFFCRPKSRPIRRQMSQESCTEHSIV